MRISRIIGLIISLSLTALPVLAGEPSNPDGTGFLGTITPQAFPNGTETGAYKISTADTKGIYTERTPTWTEIVLTAEVGAIPAIMGIAFLYKTCKRRTVTQ